MSLSLSLPIRESALRLVPAKRQAQSSERESILYDATEKRGLKLLNLKELNSYQKASLIPKLYHNHHLFSARLLLVYTPI